MPTRAGPQPTISVTGSTSVSLATGKTISTTDGNNDVSIITDSLSLSGSVQAGTGAIEVSPYTPSKPVRLGAAVAGSLSLDQAAINNLSAQYLRIGNITTGPVTASADITRNATGQNTLRIRSNSTVLISANKFTVPNLAVDASSTINLSGQNLVTNLALRSGTSGSNAITYVQATGSSYTPTTVDGVTPTFGIAAGLSLKNVPGLTPSVIYENVAIAPNPQAVVVDAYGIALSAQNTTSGSYCPCWLDGRRNRH
jgi:hypothetical protein